MARPRINLMGQHFGRLIVIEDGTRSKTNKPRWKCLCACGNTTTVQSEHLRDGSTTSCGCYRDEQREKSRLTHGLTRVGKVDRLFSIWRKVVQRCDPDSSYPHLKNYAHRGIDICDQWLDYETFAKWAYDNGYSDELSIDRIDNDGNYEPDNCRWTDAKTQARNRRSNRMVTINGVTKCLIEWTEQYDINYGTVKSRLNAGWDSKEALETRPYQRRKKVKS